jgi:hypothetical protein
MEKTASVVISDAEIHTEIATPVPILSSETVCKRSGKEIKMAWRDNPSSQEFKNECWIDFKLHGASSSRDLSFQDTFKAGYDRGFLEAMKLQIAKEKSAKKGQQMSEIDYKLKYEDLAPELHDMTASRDQYREENGRLKAEMDKLWSMFIVQCESIEGRDNQAPDNEHAKGFVSGESYAAKSIRRSVTHPKYNPADFPAYEKASTTKGGWRRP